MLFGKPEPIITSSDLRETLEKHLHKEDNEELVLATHRAVREIERLNNMLEQPKRFPEKSELPKGVTSYMIVKTIGEISETERVEF